MRKIISIQELPETKNSCAILLALCDDGTVWTFKNETWERLPEIPQDWKPC